MRLILALPHRIFHDGPAVKIAAEGEDGAFAILPRHVDFVSVLATGILTMTDGEKRETYFGVDGGILVKQAGTVHVATHRAVRESSLGRLRRRVDAELARERETTRKTRTALARLESDFIRNLMDWGKA